MKFDIDIYLIYSMCLVIIGTSSLEPHTWNPDDIEKLELVLYEYGLPQLCQFYQHALCIDSAQITLYGLNVRLPRCCSITSTE